MLSLISAAVCKTFVALRPQSIARGGEADAFGLTAGLALTGTGPEGHSSLKSTDSAVGSDHTQKVLSKKKKKKLKARDRFDPPKPLCT